MATVEERLAALEEQVAENAVVMVLVEAFVQATANALAANAAFAQEVECELDQLSANLDLLRDILSNDMGPDAWLAAVDEVVPSDGLESPDGISTDGIGALLEEIFGTGLLNELGDGRHPSLPEFVGPGSDLT